MSQEKGKPVFDEDTLAKLLEAAYVLQEHNAAKRNLEQKLELNRDRAEGEASKGASQNKPRTSGTKMNPVQDDYTVTLSRIVETQRHIQVRHLDLASALTLVAERVVEIGRASGAAIGLISDQTLVYQAVFGIGIPAPGSIVAVEQALSQPCIRTGQVFRCPDVNSMELTDPEECRRRGIESFIAAPIFRQGEEAGALELYYEAPAAFTEHDVNSCQLMAGLVTEALNRDDGRNWKTSIASERAAMLDVLEKIQPNLAALVGQSKTDDAPAKHEPSVPVASAGRAYACRKCGHKLVGGEMFCGQCGSPRTSDYQPPSMQSKVAALWEMQEARRKETAQPPTNGKFPAAQSGPTHTEADHADEVDERPFGHSLAQGFEEENLPDFFGESEIPAEETKLPRELMASLGLEEKEEEKPQPSEAETSVEEEDEKDSARTALAAKLNKPADWSSAVSAREFLEQLASSQRSGWLIRFWDTRRGDVYLAIAIILVLCVVRWGVWSKRSPHAPAAATAATTRPKPPEADISLFDRLLIELGLAEAPPTPEDRGNPAAQVWVDQKTGLYYCAGADLYGKTLKGKFTTQRDAQLDQFEPAYRKPCN